jgi:hypothetical protein
MARGRGKDARIAANIQRTLDNRAARHLGENSWRGRNTIPFEMMRVLNDCARGIHSHASISMGARPEARRRIHMNHLNPESLKPLAGKYIWWKTPEEAVAYPQRVIAQVMNLGIYSDVLSLVALVGDETLREVIRCSEAGWFSERSWAYWHYRLGLASTGQVPPLPQRSFD